MRRSLGLNFPGRYAWVLLPALLVGCSDDAINGSQVLVTEVDGVERTTTIGGGTWQADQAWRIGEPIVRVGRTEGNDFEMFSRVTDVAISPTNEIYIGDFQTREVRVFSLDGQHLFSFGRSGDGPGEFQSLGSIRIMSDGRVVVRDSGLSSRASIFQPSGEFEFSFLIERPAFLTAGGAGVWPTNDSLLVSQNRSLDSLGVSVFNARGEIVGGQVVMGVAGDQGVRVIRNGEWLFSLDNRYNPRPLLAVGPDGLIAFGTGRDFLIEVRSVDGERVRQFGRQHELTPITEADRERVVAAWGDQMRVAAPGGEIEAFEFPTHRPAYTHLLADAEGNWWAGARSGSEFDQEPTEYDVFDEGGRLLGTVAVPTMRVTQIGSDFVAGVETDSLGVQYAVLYRLAKNN